MNQSTIRVIAKQYLDKNISLDSKFLTQYNYYYKFPDNENFEKIFISKAQSIQNSTSKNLIFYLYKSNYELFGYIEISKDSQENWFKIFKKSKGKDLDIYIQDGANLLSSEIEAPIGQYLVIPTLISPEESKSKKIAREPIPKSDLAISNPLSLVNPGIKQCLDLFGLDELDILSSQNNNLDTLKEVLLKTSKPGEFRDSIDRVPQIEDMLIFPNLDKDLKQISDDEVLKNIDIINLDTYSIEEAIYAHKLYLIYKKKINEKMPSSISVPVLPQSMPSFAPSPASTPTPEPTPPVAPSPDIPSFPIPSLPLSGQMVKPSEASTSSEKMQIFPPTSKDKLPISSEKVQELYKQADEVEFLREKKELNSRIELIPYEEHLLHEANLEKEKIKDSEKKDLQKKIDELKKTGDYRAASPEIREGMIQSIAIGNTIQFVRLNINIYSLLEYLQDGGFSPHKSRAIEKFSTFFEGDLSKWTVLDPPGNGFCTIYSAILSNSQFPYPLSIANDELKQDNLIKSIITGIEKYYIANANNYLRENDNLQLRQLLENQEWIELIAPVEERNAQGQWIEKVPSVGFNLLPPPIKKEDIYSLKIGDELQQWRLQLAKDLEKLKPLQTTPPALLRFLAYIINKNIIGLGFAPQGDRPFLATIYKSLIALPDEYTIIHTRGAHTVAIVYPLMNETTTLDEYLQNKKFVKDTISNFLEESSVNDEGLSRYDKGLDLWTDILLAKEIEEKRKKQQQIYDDEMLAKRLQEEETGIIGGRNTKKQKYLKKINTKKIKKKNLRKATKKKRINKRKTKKR